VGGFPKSTGLGVEGDGADQGRAPPPAALGTRPAVDKRVGYLTVSPCWTGQVDRERVHGAPAVDASTQLFKGFCIQTGQRSSVMMHQLVRHPA